MPRRKKCVHCDELLICQACGQPQTPVRDIGKKISVQLTNDEDSLLEQKAKAAGLTKSQYIRKLMEAS